MSTYDLNASDDLRDAGEDLGALDEIAPMETGSRGFELETEGQIADSIETLNQIPEIKPEQWESLDTNERVSALQTVENQLAEIQSRPPVAVEMEEMGTNEFGGYDGHSIKINQEHISGGQPVYENLDTIVHEGRHAYQDFVVAHPESISDPSLAQTWADNFDNYLDLQTYGAELYNNQPVEADAWSYAASVCNGVYGKKDVK